MVPYSDDTVIPLQCGIQFVGIVCFTAFKLSTLKEIAPQSRGENVSAFALPSQRFRDKKIKNKKNQLLCPRVDLTELSYSLSSRNWCSSNNRLCIAKSNNSKNNK